MHHIDFYFDVISPYAHLAFHRLPVELQGLSYSVRYRPVLFAGLLKHHGQLGPAEIGPKKLWTFQQVNWLAKRYQVPLVAPHEHPFNPLALLRLLLAVGPGDGTCNRFQAEAVLAHVWQREGKAADDLGGLAQLCESLAPVTDTDARQPPAEQRAQALLSDPSAKLQLKRNTDAAIELGLFGVPSCVVNGQVFWGLDALPMLRECMEGDEWFASAAYLKAAPALGTRRR